MKISPEVAYYYVKYIEKQLTPQPHDMFDVIDANGNMVNIMFEKLKEISKQSKIRFAKSEAANIVISAELKQKEIQVRYADIIEAIVNLKEQVNNITL